MTEEILSLWPEIGLIKDSSLREKVASCWAYALEESSLSIEDLKLMPFSLNASSSGVSFIRHKRACVHISIAMARTMADRLGMNINFDYLIAGAILIDVGKLQEYCIKDGAAARSLEGMLLRHTFSGTAIAARFGLPPEVQHIIATHSYEGDSVNRTTESIIVHHADFASYEPFKNK